MSKQRRKSSDCPNCGNHLRHDDEFCSRCGQENHELRVPIGHLFFEFIESITHFDGKLWATLRAMAVPGKITDDYLAGKRARFVPPGRLYIFTSVVYFFLLGVSLNNGNVAGLRLKPAVADSTSTESADTIPTDSVQGERVAMENGEIEASFTVPDSLLDRLRPRADRLTREELDSALVSIGWEPKWINRRLLAGLAHIPDDQQAAMTYLMRLFPKAMSYSMFLLMPFLAVLLELLVARRRFYYEHFIFSVHVHIASFLISIVQTLLGFVLPEFLSAVVGLVATIAMVVYFILALKLVYRKSIGAAIGYSFLLALPYYLATAVLVLVFFVVGFMWV
ncbi:MAG: DUF3667 domain-containing protein [Flavobacteriales bacterium]|nr:MAG: DUF3667 domain-containing protein [Flavobacteriales bacterium]